MTTKIKGFTHIRRFFTILIVLLVLPAFVFAEGGKKEKFDAGEMIMEHVSDGHSWHVAGNFSIPLPVMIYSTDKGFSAFSSSKLADGAIYNGYKESGIHILAVNPDGSVNKDETAKLWDFSITKNAATIMLTGLLLVLTFFSVAKGYKTRGTAAPKGVQSFFEPIVVFIRDDLAIPTIGEKKYERFMPYLLTLFFFIAFMNLLGLIPFFPGGANTMGNITITMTMALFTLVIMLLNSNKYYWSHTLWMPGVPALVKILILTPIEILGIVLKPFTLMIRIFANILAGHIVALSFFSLIFIFGTMSAAAGYGVSVVSVLFTVIMLLLDTLVALIQAYVFTLLSAIYFGMVTAEAEHH